MTPGTVGFYSENTLMATSRIFWVLGLISLIGCTKPEPKPKAQLNAPSHPGGLPAGVHDESIVIESGDVLRYTIAIPESYNDNQPTPLIVALHFGGKVTPHFARGVVQALVLPGLGELNAIIVAPDSLAGPWNNNKNEKAIFELMDFMTENYNIDESKTLLTGFSMGGHGTWYIGSRNQDRFSALIPIAGALQVGDEIVWTIPVYVIHSRADSIVPIEPTEKYLEQLSVEQRKLIKIVPVEEILHFQTGMFAGPLKDAVPWVKKVWNIQ